MRSFNYSTFYTHVAKDMQRVGKGARPSGAIAHHDLPTAFEDRFIAAGIDPNHGDNGRWIQKAVHDGWSNAPGFISGGPFNQVWRDFFQEFPEATGSQILAKLDEIRNGYVYTLNRSGGLPPLPIRFD